ncbi:MAG: glutamate--tRNA ligase [Hyphomicrobiales bacterium]
MTVKTRFAPSPTGLIHVGNARTALLNWLFAKKHSGTSLLRFDDTDTERSKEEYAVAIAQDLDWLGTPPDETARQSERFERYDEVASKLRADGRLYACYETPEELDAKRKRQRLRGMPPVYDRTGLNLSDEERANLEAEGRKPHWRFLLNQSDVTWTDLIRGDVTIDAASLSDPVLIRADGTYLYTLPSVTDDIDFGITHVIRGEDHVANTGVQIQIFAALDADVPTFAHHNLLTGADGRGLSKRLGALSIGALRDQGLEAMAVASHAATIGTSDPVLPHKSMDDLVELFDLSKLSRAPARFDEAELRGLNAKLLHELDYDAVRERLEALGIGGGDVFWNTVRGNIDVLGDATNWWSIIDGDVTPDIAEEDKDFCTQARDLLPADPWTGDTWKEWTGAVKEATGRKGKSLFMPLRKALTGLSHGPELVGMLPLIGREKAADRLSL